MQALRSPYPRSTIFFSISDYIHLDRLSARDSFPPELIKLKSRTNESSRVASPSNNRREERQRFPHKADVRLSAYVSRMEANIQAGVSGSRVRTRCTRPTDGYSHTVLICRRTSSSSSPSTRLSVSERACPLSLAESRPFSARRSYIISRCTYSPAGMSGPPVSPLPPPPVLLDVLRSLSGACADSRSIRKASADVFVGLGLVCSGAD